MLMTQLEELQDELNERKANYVKSMRYMHRNRSAQSQLMFIFSADNLMQMFRRMRFMREYASFQRAQGEEVKQKQEEVNQKFQQLTNAQEHKRVLLSKDEQERRALEGKQTEQQNVVSTLQKEQKTIQNIIAQQKKKDAALNAQIDRLIAEEVARQKAKAAAEAKKRAEAANWHVRKPLLRLPPARMPVVLPKPKQGKRRPRRKHRLPRIRKHVRLPNSGSVKQSRNVWQQSVRRRLKTANMPRLWLLPVKRPTRPCVYLLRICASVAVLPTTVVVCPFPSLVPIASSAIMDSIM